MLTRFPLGSDDGKEVMNLAMVDGPELEALGHEKESRDWPVEVRQGGVWDGHSVPDARRMESFAVSEDTFQVPFRDVTSARQQSGEGQDRFALVEHGATYERDSGLGEHFGKAHGKP